MKTDCNNNVQQPARGTKRPNDASGSVFDRLYKTSTASSKTRKVTGPVVNKCILSRESEAMMGKATRKENAGPIGTKKTAKKQVFNRLYEKGTAASSSKRITQERNGGQTSSRVARSAMKPKNNQEV